MKFFQLVQNEWMKANSKRQYFFYLFIVVIVALAGVAGKVWPKFTEGMGYLEFSNTLIAGLSTFITMFIIVIAAQTMTDEYKDGTIKQLLIRPASRASVLLSKYINNILSLLTAYFVLLSSSLIAGLILFGTQVHGDATVLTLLKTIAYILPGAIFMMTLSFFLATILKTIGFAISLTFMANFLGGVTVLFVSKYAWGKYLIFSNTNLSMYNSTPSLDSILTPMQEGMSLGFSLMIIALYTFTLYLIASVIFAKRDVQT